MYIYRAEFSRYAHMCAFMLSQVCARRVAAIPTPTPRLGSIPTSNRYEIPFTHYDELPPASGLVLFALRANRTRSGAGGFNCNG